MKQNEGNNEAPKFLTLNDMMIGVAKLTDAIINGTVDPKIAGHGLRGYGLLFRGVELSIQGARLDHTIRKDLGRRVGQLPPIDGDAEGCPTPVTAT